MKMRNLSFLLMLAVVFSMSSVKAQCDHEHHKQQLEQHNVRFHSCFLDEIVLEHAKRTPDVVENYLIFEENKRQIIEQMRNNPHLLKNERGTDTLIDGKRIIPVVFHVVHKYGVENISEQQVEDAIYHLNLDYNRLNTDTAATYSLFKSRAADAQIEFRLAKIDPWGNCTDGINRVYDQRTDYAYFNVMRDNAWPYSKYMNVYAVNFIYPEGMVLPAGAVIGGLSPFTPDNALSPTGGDTLLDGVLVRHDCVGTIGTAQSMAGSGINNYNRVMTHETGHFFNLYHPFQNLIAQVLGMDNCTHISWLGLNGDEVDDTPPTAGAVLGCPAPGSLNTCPTTDISGYGIEPDMIENYMDYANGQCQNIFTVGQLARVNATLMGTRRSIWSYENLVATGVLDTMPSNCAPKADFSSNRKMICAGAAAIFTDFSFNGTPTTWEWVFPGGTPSSSTDDVQSVTYSTPGFYDVTLIVSNGVGSDTLTKQNYIYVGETTGVNTAPFAEGFEAASSLNGWMTEDSQPGVSKWQRVSGVAYTGSYSLKQNSFEALIGSTEAIITPSFDLSNMQYPRLKFQMAYKGITQSNPLGGGDEELYGELRVSISTNCGQTWMPRKVISGANLTTAGSGASDAFTPSINDWREEVVAALNNISNHPNVMFKFEYIHLGGNNLYIDDINIYNDNVGIDEEIAAFLDLNIYPNPVTQNTVIDFTLVKNCEIKINIVDVLGKEISEIHNGKMEEGAHSINIGAHTQLKAGIYFVNFTYDTSSITRRIIVY